MIPSRPIRGQSRSRCSPCLSCAIRLSPCSSCACELPSVSYRLAVDRVHPVVGRLRLGVGRVGARRRRAAWRATAAPISSNTPGGDRAEQRRSPRGHLAGGRAPCTGRPLVSAISCIVSGLRSAIPPQATISSSAIPCSVEVVDDPSVAVRDRLEQRAVDLRRACSAASARRSRRSGRRRRGSSGCR